MKPPETTEDNGDTLVYKDASYGFQMMLAVLSYAVATIWVAITIMEPENLIFKIFVASFFSAMGLFWYWLATKDNAHEEHEE